MERKRKAIVILISNDVNEVQLSHLSGKNINLLSLCRENVLKFRICRILRPNLAKINLNCKHVTIKGRCVPVKSSTHWRTY